MYGNTTAGTMAYVDWWTSDSASNVTRSTTTWDPWGPYGNQVRTDVTLRVVSPSNDRFEDFRQGLKKSAAQYEAMRLSLAMAVEPHPQRRSRRERRRVPASQSQEFHWISQRQRCPGLRAPIPGYDRASVRP